MVISYIGLANQTEKNNVNTLDCNDDLIGDDDPASDMDFCGRSGGIMFVGVITTDSCLYLCFAPRMACF